MRPGSPELAPMSGAEARLVASAMVAEIRDGLAPALEMGPIDLGPALEQVLFSNLRAGRVGAGGRRWGPAIRRPAAALGVLRPRPSLPQADVMLLVLTEIHRRLFASVEAELRAAEPGISVLHVAAGHGARDRRLRVMPRISQHLSRRSALVLLRGRLDARRLAAVSAGWDRLVGPSAAAAARAAALDAIARLAVDAARLHDSVSVVRPKAVVMYDEIDAWSRLTVQVAHGLGVRAVDLPHAEAVDADAIRGVGYDLMAVYGPRAADVLLAAGVAQDRIAVVGPARFDRLVRAARAEIDSPPRVVFAAQYRGGRMTEAVRREILTCAIAAAKQIGAAVDLVPHPTESPAAWQALLADRRIAPGPNVRVRVDRDLHELLPGAALLVTGWSNSVYEAVLAGVPAITVHVLDGPAPMPFADEGIAAEARDAAGAAQVARRLVAPETREAALRSARAALTEHLGPLDGAAAKRTAAVILRAIEG